VDIGMSGRTVRMALAFVGLMTLLLQAVCNTAMAGNNPVDENWWPSEFGADDSIGALNYITPEKRLEAVRLVKQGKTLTLGMPYQQDMPLVAGRTFTLLIPGAGRPLWGPMRWQDEAFKLSFNDEIVTSEIGQVGTQFDGLGHPMIWVKGTGGWAEGNYMYNKRRLEDTPNGHGLQANGEFGSSEPGVSVALCDYLASRKITMLLADQGAIEPVDKTRGPGVVPFGYCHMNLVVRRGIYLFENIDEFLFTWAPLKLVGATGSPGNPIVAW
jgi:hypothetical protein